MAAQTIPFIKNTSISKIISTHFPRINKESFLETSIQKVYTDTFLPINNYRNDGFIEFRLPASVGQFIDLSQIILQFKLEVQKRDKVDSSTWSPLKTTVSGDHYDIINFSAVTIFKHLNITMNGVQVVNDPLYTYSSYIKLLTTFPLEEIPKIGKLYNFSQYNKIQSSFEDDTYFTGLDSADPISIRLNSIRNNGTFCRAPLIPDLSQTNMFLIDGIDMSIKLDLHDETFIINTAQQEETLSHTHAKKYFYKISDVKWHVRQKTEVSATKAQNEISLASCRFYCALI